jgi:flagellin-specific chaperone FliS
MTDEDVVDCIMEVDKVLEELECALEEKQYKKAMEKLREARDAIEELREDDDVDDTKEVEMNMMNRLK